VLTCHPHIKHDGNSRDHVGVPIDHEKTEDLKCGISLNALNVAYYRTDQQSVGQEVVHDIGYVLDLTRQI
jgi:hypothetical protein